MRARIQSDFEEIDGLSEDELFVDLVFLGFFEESVEDFESLDLSCEGFLISEELESELSDEVAIELDLLP